MDFGTRRISSLFATVPLLLFAGLCLFLALAYRQTDLVLLSLLVLGVMGSLRLWASLSLFRVNCASFLDKTRVFAGERLTLEARVDNRKALPVWLEIDVHLHGVKGVPSGETLLTAGSGLLWYQETSLRWNILAGSRGVHEIGPLRVASSDLFGFFPRERKPDGPLQVIVYPRLVPIGPFSLPRRDFFGIAGSESPVKDPVYILGTTDYHQGRPAKHIHWKASARHHRLQEKVFEPSGQEKVLLVVDVEEFTGERAHEPFEHMLEVVASVAVQLDRRGRAVGLLTNGIMTGKGSPFLRVTRSGGQLPALLEALARLGATPQGRIADVLGRGLTLPWGVSCAYFGYEETEATRLARRRFKERGMPVEFLMLNDLAALMKAGVGSSLNCNGLDETQEPMARAS